MSASFVATFAAALTPAGRGAVATIVVEGPHACVAIERLFAAARSELPAEFAINSISFGRWKDSGEEVVVSRRASQRFEIHCHGGLAAVEAVLNSLADQHCQVIDAAAWLEQHQSDRLSAEATTALMRARTARAAAILLDQQAGALRRDLAAIVDQLAENNVPRASLGLQTLLSHAAAGRHLVEPFRVVLCGPANVGKSTLLNALLGYSRSIVCDQPGTTRDVVSATTVVDGWPVDLADTAGLRDVVADSIEQQGLVRALEQAASADLLLVIFDVMTTDQTVDALLEQVASQRAGSIPPVVVYNKCDLEVEPSMARAGVAVSARTGAGLPALLDLISRRLVPAPPPIGAGVPFAPAHVLAIEQAQAWLAAGNLGRAQQAIEGLFRDLSPR